MAANNRRVHALLHNRRRRDQIIGYSIILLSWEAIGRATPDLVLPPISDIVIAVIEIYSGTAIYDALAVSIRQLVVGFLLAAAFALLVGFLMGRSDTIEYLLDSYVNLLFVTSYAALLPLLIILFGIQFRFRVAVVFLSAVFHMIFTFKAGAENVDQELTNTARVFGASGIQLYRSVLIPAALPFVIAGLRLGIGRAWKGMVVAELFVVVGVGSLLQAYQRNLQIPELFVLFVTLMVLGASSVKLLYWLQHRVAPWGSTEEIR